MRLFSAPGSTLNQKRAWLVTTPFDRALAAVSNFREKASFAGTYSHAPEQCSFAGTYAHAPERASFTGTIVDG